MPYLAKVNLDRKNEIRFAGISFINAPSALVRATK